MVKEYQKGNNGLNIRILRSGLSSREVSERFKKGLSNVDSSVKPKSISEIFKKNFFTLFNFINFILAIMISFTGSFKNLTFMFIVVSNSLISLFQELRSRNATENLKLISSTNSLAIRDHKQVNIRSNEIVKDDVLVLKAGDQIIVDCIIGEGSCEVNESLLTGESDLISKNPGDNLYAGSFVVSGKVTVVASKVGKNTYSAKISRGLKNISVAKSEIMLAVQKIIKIVSFIIVPAGFFLFLTQLKISNYDYSFATLKTSAALIGMIPSGLALLTSSVLALGATRLSKKKILAKDIYSVESLARINTLCLDKTGTITEGSFEVVGTVSYKNLLLDSLKVGNFGDSYLFRSLEIISSAFESGNETFNSIKSKFGSNSVDYKIVSIVPFTSDRKFSSVFVENLGSFAMGSAEFIFKDKKIENLLSKYSEYRVLSVAHSDVEITKDYIPEDIRLVGIVLLKDKIRKDAAETIDYFQKNGVNVKIISGDNPDTISKIAKSIGLKDYDKSLDVSKVEKHSEILKSVSKYSIFARVTPERKRELIMALKSKGHQVAMIGDGVNDILALKEADCSVAMANGSSAAREISHLILVNSNFSSVKDAVFEGRRAINNIQTTSSLFLVKTIYSMILTIILLLFSIPYPFEPAQMMLLNLFTVGVPSFLLALEPNSSPIKKSLFSNMIRVSIPTAITVCISILLCFFAKSFFNIPINMYSTMSVVATGFIGFELLWKICQPLNAFRSSVFLVLSIGFIVSFIRFGSFFFLITPTTWEIRYFFIFFSILLVSHFIYKFLSK